VRASDYAKIVAAAARNEAAARLGRPTLPYKLEFIVTFACGSRCRTCNIWSRYLEDPAARDRELPAERIIAAARSVRSSLRWLSLTGGELTDRPDIVELVDGLLAAVGDRLALFQLTTNGIDPDRVAAVFPAIVRRARGIPTYVTMSLDGLGKTYERVRGVPDGYAKVKRSMALLDELAAREPHLTTGYQVTLSSLNAHQAEALFDEASRGHERPIFTIATNALQLTRGKVDVDVRRAGPEVQEALTRVWRRYPRRHVSDVPPLLHLGTTARFFRTGEAPLPCTAGQATLTIDPYGRVLQCDSRAEALGDLAETGDDLAALCRSGPFQARLAAVRGCRACWTPCHAYPTLMHHPARAAALYAAEVARRGR